MMFSQGENYLLPIESACDDGLGEHGTMSLIYDKRISKIELFK